MLNLADSSQSTYDKHFSKYSHRRELFLSPVVVDNSLMDKALYRLSSKVTRLAYRHGVYAPIWSRGNHIAYSSSNVNVSCNLSIQRQFCSARISGGDDKDEDKDKQGAILDDDVPESYYDEEIETRKEFLDLAQSLNLGGIDKLTALVEVSPVKKITRSCNA